MRLGWIKGERLIEVLNWLGTLLIPLYFYSMIIHPWIIGGWDWSYVHQVWMDWQTLNVGVLAFISSMVAFNISKYNSNQQRQREFVAARSFLPEALSDLTLYLRSSAELLLEAWNRARDPLDRCKSPLNRELPQLPLNYRDIFSRCISLAEPEVAQYLSSILIRLQVHNSRINDLAKDFQPESITMVLTDGIKSYIYSLAQLYALVGRIFGYARGTDEFDDSALTWDDFANAYRNLDIWVDQVDDLEGFTKRVIERGSNDEKSA